MYEPDTLALFRERVTLQVGLLPHWSVGGASRHSQFPCGTPLGIVAPTNTHVLAHVLRLSPKVHRK